MDSYPDGTVGTYQGDAAVRVLLWESAGKAVSPAAGLDTAALAVWGTGTAAAVVVAVSVVVPAVAVADPPVDM